MATPAEKKPHPRGPKKPAHKPRVQPKGERASRSMPTVLNSRQKRLKALLIQSRGMLNVAEAAKTLGVNRLTIWHDRRVIQALAGPDQLEGWDEDAAIRKTIDFYEAGLDVLMAELDRLLKYEEGRRKVADNLSLDYNMTNLRLGVYSQLATWRKDLSNFLIAIGLIREAPKRLILEDERISKATTDEDIRAEIAGVREQLAALRARREAAATASS